MIAQACTHGRGRAEIFPSAAFPPLCRFLPSCHTCELRVPTDRPVCFQGSFADVRSGRRPSPGRPTQTLPAEGRDVSQLFVLRLMKPLNVNHTCLSYIKGFLLQVSRHSDLFVAHPHPPQRPIDTPQYTSASKQGTLAWSCKSVAW